MKEILLINLGCLGIFLVTFLLASYIIDWYNIKHNNGKKISAVPVYIAAGVSLLYLCWLFIILP